RRGERAGRDHEDVRANLHRAARGTNRLLDGARRQRAAFQQTVLLQQVRGDAGRRWTISGARAREGSERDDPPDGLHGLASGLAGARAGAASGPASSPRKCGAFSNASSFSISTFAPSWSNAARAVCAVSVAAAQSP